MASGGHYTLTSSGSSSPWMSCARVRREDGEAIPWTVYSAITTPQRTGADEPAFIAVPFLRVIWSAGGASRTIEVVAGAGPITVVAEAVQVQARILADGKNPYEVATSLDIDVLVAEGTTGLDVRPCLWRGGVANGDQPLASGSLIQGPGRLLTAFGTNLDADEATLFFYDTYPDAFDPADYAGARPTFRLVVPGGSEFSIDLGAGGRPFVAGCYWIASSDRVACTPKVGANISLDYAVSTL